MKTYTPAVVTTIALLTICIVFALLIQSLVVARGEIRSAKGQLVAAKSELKNANEQLVVVKSELKNANEQLAVYQQKQDAFEEEKRQREQISARFRSQADRLIEEGAKLQAMTDQGVKYETFESQLVSVKGPYSLLVESWPAKLDGNIKKSLERAFQAWNYADKMWLLKIYGIDGPTEPGYAEIVRFAPTELVVKTNDRNENYLPTDPNIGILLSIGSESFESAKKALLRELDR